MKQYLILVFLILLVKESLFSGELIFGWNKVNEAGGIQDMKFMPDNNMFILTCNGNELQIRNSADGELIKKYPGVSGLFEFTPDSTKLVLIKSTQSRKAKIELRNLEDLGLIQLDSIDLGADTLDPQFGTKLDTYFRDLKIDPIRPYAYVIFNKTNHIAHPNVDTFRLWVYNYLTMERIYDLTPENDKNLTFGSNCLSVSRDGRYLAAISEGKSYLRIWDLNTMKLIREFRLYDPYCQDCSCKPKDMKFSELNTDKIYISGAFPRQDSNKSLYGLLLFSISDNQINDSTLAVKPKQIHSGYFNLFDTEERLIHTTYLQISIINLPQTNTEFQFNIKYPEVGSWVELIYSKKKDIFIGWANEYFSSGIYLRPSSINNINHDNQDIVYPNPTSGIVSIDLPFEKIIKSIGISNSEGKLFDLPYKFDGISKYSFDFTKFPDGVYFCNIISKDHTLTYKIIVEK